MKYKELTPDMKKRIIRAMDRTWQTIAGDMFQCLADCGEKPIMSRAAVIEVVTDADRMEAYGGDKEAYETMRDMTYTDVKKIGKEAFPYTRYSY
jgi:hypothetical protein